MKINILDAGIRYRAGHHYDYGLKLARQYSSEGHDIHVYAGADLQEDAEGDFQAVGAVSKLFSAAPYQSTELADSYAGELVQHGRDRGSLAQDLTSVREADLWIWPTLRPAEIEACIWRKVTTPIVGLVYWDPGIEACSIEAMLWRAALVAARDTGLNLTLASVESELRHRFVPILAEGKFAVIAQPVDGPPISEPKSKLQRIGFFGHQREEKGSALMEQLVPQLVGEGFAITIHNSFTQAEIPPIPGVDMLGYVEDLSVPIAQCDFVVLPYDVERYRARGSGILVECLALGIPVTAPFGTLPGRTVERFGVGPLFNGNGKSAIYRSIKFAERNFAKFAANAHRTAQQYARHNGIARFAADLIKASSGR